MDSKSAVVWLRYLSVFVLMILLSVHPAYSQSEASPQGYSVYKKISLYKGGQLLLLQDSRINEKLRGEMWGVGGVDQLDEKDQAIFSEMPPRNAVLIVLDAKGKVTYNKQLDSVLAELEMIKFYPGGRIFIYSYGGQKHRRRFIRGAGLVFFRGQQRAGEIAFREEGKIREAC